MRLSQGMNWLITLFADPYGGWFRTFWAKIIVACGRLIDLELERCASLKVLCSRTKCTIILNLVVIKKCCAVGPTLTLARSEKLLFGLA